MKTRLCFFCVILWTCSLPGGAGLRTAAASGTATGVSPREAPPQGGTRKPFRIRTDVRMVMTDLTIVGPDFDALSGEDFVVFDNGVPHPVEYFSRNEMPLAIALLIDTSMSVEPYLPLIQVAAGSALLSLNPDDQVVLFSFNNKPKRHSSLTFDRSEIAEKIGKLDFKLGTEIFKTIVDAANYLQENAPNRRRAVIMISDNYHVPMDSSFSAPAPSPSRFSRFPAASDFQDLTREQARAAAVRTALTLYSIKTPSDDWDRTRSAPVISRIANDTGGEVIRLNTWASLQDAMGKVLARLRKQYTVGFNPTDLGEEGSFHKLEVKFSDEKRCPECRMLSRVGYYTGVSSPLPSGEKKGKKPKLTQQEMNRLIIEKSVLAIGSYPGMADLEGIPFRVWTKRLKDKKGDIKEQVNVRVDARQVKFKNLNDRHACRLHIGIFYFDESGKLKGAEVKVHEGQLREETYEQIVESGIAYLTEIPLKSREQTLRVVVYDEYGDRVGCRSAR
jgi:Ca-activated chloride channel family protein